uniref:(northern house mosquito) hypothetical protein n=1 Tax=Culex pipiens TaxID=7175 RepID=A0A8D7ZSC5_CULPI
MYHFAAIKLLSRIKLLMILLFQLWVTLFYPCRTHVYNPPRGRSVPKTSRQKHSLQRNSLTVAHFLCVYFPATHYHPRWMLHVQTQHTGIVAICPQRSHPGRRNNGFR